MRTQHEATQRGNPYKLSVKQHIFPARSVGRFAGRDGKVCLRIKTRRLTKRLKPEADIFCLRRAWDHRTETGFIKSIEDRFQKISEQVILSPEISLDDKQQHDVRLFFALWNFRASFHFREDATSKGLLFARDSLSKDQEEKLESNGYIFGRGPTIPARMMAGPLLQIQIGQYLRRIGNVKWSVIAAEKGEFAVPDVPSFCLIPILPALCLYQGEESGTVSERTLAHINLRQLEGSKRYIFARDFEHCSGLESLKVSSSSEG